MWGGCANEPRTNGRRIMTGRDGKQDKFRRKEAKMSRSTTREIHFRCYFYFYIGRTPNGTKQSLPRQPSKDGSVFFQGFSPFFLLIFGFPRTLSPVCDVLSQLNLILSDLSFFFLRDRQLNSSRIPMSSKLRKMCRSKG